MTNKTNFTNLELLIIGSTVCIYTVNYLLDAFGVSEDLELFQRSGSAVVCIGIWFGLLNITGFLDNNIKLQNQEMAKKIDQAAAMTIGHPQKRSLDAETMDLAHAAADENWVKTQQIKTRITMIELYLLIGGTFVWGYGDILVYHF